MKQKMATPSFSTSTHIAFLKNWQFQLSEFSHVVHWRCSIVLAYISHHLQEEEWLSLKHMAWPEHSETLQERETSSNIYNHENFNALRAQNRHFSQPTQENCNPQTQPQNKNSVFLEDLWDRWQSVKLTVTSPLEFWNRDARLENRGSVGRGTGHRDTEQQVWQNRSLHLPFNHEYGFLQRFLLTMGPYPMG